MKNLFDLENRVVIVTGGMGQLGQQYTSILLEHNAKVVILDLKCSIDQITSDMKVAVDSGFLLLTEADITKKAELEQAACDIEKGFGPIYGLINNAALDSPPNSPAEENGPFETYPEESWDRIMEVNAKGVFLACQVFGTKMKMHKQGSIVNIASIYGLLSPNQNIYEYRRQNGEVFYKPVAYSTSKSSVYNLTRYLAT